MDMQTKIFQDLDQNMNLCNEFFKQNHQNSNFNELEQMLVDIKKLVVRNTLISAFGFIDKVVENGERSMSGMNKQFNVSSIQITPNDEILLVGREVLGIDVSDKKYILDPDTSLLNLKDIISVF